MMKQLPRPMFFPLIVLICCCFCFGKAIDCGGNNVTNTIVVDQQGKGAFKTIQSAIDSIKSNNDQWIKIHVNPGRYVEKVQIPREKPCVILEGSSRETTLITYSDGRQGESDQEKSTFTSFPSNVILSGITFENSFGYKFKGQAPAAAIYGNNSAIFSCGFLGYQDTLLDAQGNHYFKDCYIQGGMDFIFGFAQSYYEDCVMNATQFKSHPPGFVTAQYRTSLNDPSGFVFRRGRVDGIGKVNLGRAWGPYSRVIFWETYLSSVVLPKGWSAWHFVGQEGKLTYAEVNCTGPGAKTTGRVHWEKKPKDIHLKEYDLSSFINNDNWLAKIPTMSV